MQHFATFHLGLHCLPMYLFSCFQYTCTKDYKIACSPNSTNDIASAGRPNIMIKYAAFVDVYAIYKDFPSCVGTVIFFIVVP